MPSFEKLLEVVDWRAKVLECVSEGGTHKRKSAASSKRFPNRPSCAASVEEGDVCITCKRQGHLLYSCISFSELQYPSDAKYKAFCT